MCPAARAGMDDKWSINQCPLRYTRGVDPLGMPAHPRFGCPTRSADRRGSARRGRGRVNALGGGRIPVRLAGEAFGAGVLPGGVVVLNDSGVPVPPVDGD